MDWILTLSLLLSQFAIPTHTGALAGPSVPLPTVVQSVANSSACNFGTCGPISLGSAATSGNKIIVQLNNSDSGTDSCTDNLSNTLTEQSGSPQPTISSFSSGFYQHQLAYTVPSSGVTAITCTFTGSFAEMYVIEVHGSSGAATMQAFTTSAYAFGNCTPSPSTSPTASPSIAFGVYYGDLATTSAGSGWAAIGTVNTNGNPMFVEYKAQTGTSAVTATITNTCGAHGPDGFLNIW